MGLGLVKDRLGKTNEALPILEQALEHYLKERTQGHQVPASPAPPPPAPPLRSRGKLRDASERARRECAKRPAFRSDKAVNRLTD